MSSKTRVVDCEVCIVGAGTCGLYAAAYLGQLGIRTIVLEESEDVRQDGRCIELMDDAITDLQRVGIESFLRKGLAKRRFAVFKAFPCVVGPPKVKDEIEMDETLNQRQADHRHDASMVVLETASADEGPFGWPTAIQVNPGRLNEALLGRICCECDSVEVKFRHEILDVLEEDSSVTVTSEGDSRLVVRAKFLLGADVGVRRAVCADDDWCGDEEAPKQFFCLDIRFVNPDAAYFFSHQNTRFKGRTAFVETSSDERPASFAWIDHHKGRIGYYANPEETFASASRRDAIGDFLLRRFGLRLGEDVEIDHIHQYWERSRVLRTSRRGTRCFLVCEALQECALGIDDISLSLGIRETALICWKLAFAVKEYAPLESLTRTIDAEIIPHAAKSLDVSKKMNDMAFASSSFIKCLRDLCWTCALKMRSSDASDKLPYEADERTSLVLPSDHYFSQWARPSFWGFRRRDTSQLLSTLFPSKATGKVFVQPFVVENTKIRLFDGVPLDAFVFLGFDGIDPRRHVSPGRLEVLHLIDVAFLTILPTDAVHEERKEEVYEPRRRRTRAEDEGTPLMNARGRRRILREAPTGGVLVLPTWRSRHGAPDILILRPDKFIYAAITISQLNDAVDELLVKLGIKHDDDPTEQRPPQSPSEDPCC